MNIRATVAALTAALAITVGLAAPAHAATDPKIIDAEMRFDAWNAFAFGYAKAKAGDKFVDVFTETAKNAPIGVNGNIITGAAGGTMLCVTVSRAPEADKGTASSWAFIWTVYENGWLPYDTCEQAQAVALTLVNREADYEVRSLGNGFERNKNADGTYSLPEFEDKGDYIAGYWNTQTPVYEEDGQRVANMIFPDLEDGSSSLTEYIVSDDRTSVCFTINDGDVSRVWNSARGGIQPKNVINCAGDTIPTAAESEWIEWKMRNFFEEFGMIPAADLTDMGRAAFAAAAEVQPTLDRNNIRLAGRAIFNEQLLANANTGEAFTGVVPLAQVDGDRVLFAYEGAEWKDLGGVTLDAFGISKNGKEFCAAFSYHGQTAVFITGQSIYWNGASGTSPVTCQSGRFTPRTPNG